MSILKKLAVNTSITACSAITLLAVAMPQAQAVGVGFSNARVNGVSVFGTQEGDGPVTTIYSLNRTFTFTFDLYNNPAFLGEQDTFEVSFFRDAGSSTLPRVPAFSFDYLGNGTPTQPTRVSFVRSFNRNGVFNDGFAAGMVDSTPDYDPITPPNGPFEVDDPQFNITLVAGSAPPTPVPFEFSPGLGILALGACGALAKLNSSVRKLKFTGSAFSNQ